MRTKIQLIALFSSVFSLIYIIPHSHMDYAWLETFEDYYRLRSKSVFSGMVQKMSTDARIRFTIGELCFLRKFLEDSEKEAETWEGEESLRPEKASQKIAEFLQKKTLSLAHGQFISPDLATPGWEDFLESAHYGNLYSVEKLGQAGRVAWQLDSFGSSKTFAFLAAKMGYKDMIICRVDNQLKRKLIDEKKLQLRWVLPQGQSIYLHISHDHYTNLDIPTSGPYLEEFTTKLEGMFRSDGFMLFGDDFYFQNFAGNFAQIFSSVEADPRLRIATFEEYLARLGNNKSDFPDYEGDFFNYDNQGVWSGYYTSQPGLKREIRDIFRFVRAALSAIFSRPGESRASRAEWPIFSDQIFADLSSLIHHDAITGTSTEIVNESYRWSMDKIRRFFTRLLTPADRARPLEFEKAKIECGVPEKELEEIDGVLMYNQLGSQTKFVAEIPIRVEGKPKKFVVEKGGKSVFSELVCVTFKECSLFFDAKLEPLEIVFFSVKKEDPVESKKEENLPQNHEGLPTIKEDDFPSPKKGDSSPSNSPDLGSAKIEENSPPKSSKETGPISEDEGYFLPYTEIEGVRAISFEDWRIRAMAYRVVVELPGQNVQDSIGFLSVDSEAGAHYVNWFNDLSDVGKLVEKFQRFSVFRGEMVEFVDFETSFGRVRIGREKGKGFYWVETYFRGNINSSCGTLFMMSVVPRGFTVSSTFSSDSNGLFTTPRDRLRRLDKDLYPTTLFAQLENQLGEKIRVFVDRPQAAGSVTEDELLFNLNRSSKNFDNKGLNEALFSYPVYTRHYVLHFSGKEEPDEAIELTNRIELSNLFLLTPKRIPSTLLSPSKAEFPSELRLNYQAIDQSSFLLRVTNRSETKSSTFPAADFFAKSFANVEIFEVDFGYSNLMPADRAVRPVASSYTLAPLEAATFLFNFS